MRKQACKGEAWYRQRVLQLADELRDTALAADRIQARLNRDTLVQDVGVPAHTVDEMIKMASHVSLSPTQLNFGAGLPIPEDGASVAEWKTHIRVLEHLLQRLSETLKKLEKRQTMERCMRDEGMCVSTALQQANKEMASENNV